MTDNNTKTDFVPKIYKQPEFIDEDKNTKLHYAAAHGNKKEVLDYIKNVSKNVDVENYLAWTPLMMACRRGHLEVAKCLVENRADPSRSNRFGMNGFIMAVVSGNLELVEFILEYLFTGGFPRLYLESSLSPISMAIIFQNQKVLEYLLERDFDCNVAAPLTKVTPLMFASALESSEAFAALMNVGADSNMKNHIGHTAYNIDTLRKQMQKSVSTDKPVTIQIPQLLSSFPTTGPQVPCLIVSPQTSMFSMHSPMISVGKCPHYSPYYIPPPPNVTPITPICQPMFFPPDFSPMNIYSQSPNYLNSSLLNARLNSPSVYLSPMNFPSPCV